MRNEDKIQNEAPTLPNEKIHPDIILIGTGSKVQLVLAAQQKLNEQNIAARVASMPSWELFEKQNNAYKEKYFPRHYRNGWQ